MTLTCIFQSFVNHFKGNLCGCRWASQVSISEYSYFSQTCFRIFHRSHNVAFSCSVPEVRSWSNLISEERVKFSEQNSENLMKIGWKIRKLWNFEVSQIFRKHFLTSPYEYANEWVDDVIASLLAIYFVHKILKILIFAPTFDSYVPHIKIYWC